MPRIDLFNFFRWWLGWIVTIYATIITIQSLWGWYIWLAGSDKYISLLRRYVIVQGLRLRFRAFWGDVIICVLLTVIFFILWHAHHLIYDLGDKLQALRAHRNASHEPRLVQSTQPRCCETAAGCAAGTRSF